MVRKYSDSQSSALCLTDHLPWNVSIESMLLRLMWHARGCDFSWRDAAIRVGNQEGCTGTGSVSAVSASKAIYTFTAPSSFISDCVCANGDALNAFYRAGSFTWWKYIIIHMIHIILWIGTFLVLGPLWLSTMQKKLTTFCCWNGGCLWVFLHWRMIQDLSQGAVNFLL